MLSWCDQFVGFECFSVWKSNGCDNVFIKIFLYNFFYCTSITIKTFRMVMGVEVFMALEVLVTTVEPILKNTIKVV